MGKVMIVQLFVMLLYITYRGIFCEEVVENYQVNPEIQNPFSKLSLRDLVSYLEATRQNDLRYAKRSDRRDLTPGSDFDPSLEISSSDPESTLKNIDLLWQTVEEEIKKPQIRFLSPRLGRNAYPHGLNLPPLPPRIGKRNTVFAPRMGK